MADITKENVIEFIANMSVLELSQFVKELEEKFGVSAAAPLAMMAAAPAQAAAPAAEEKTEFDVILTSVGDKKIQVIKEVGRLPRWGSRKPRPWWKKPQNRSKRGFPRTRPRRSRPS